MHLSEHHLCPLLCPLTGPELMAGRAGPGLGDLHVTSSPCCPSLRLMEGIHYWTQQAVPVADGSINAVSPGLKPQEMKEPHTGLHPGHPWAVTFLHYSVPPPRCPASCGSALVGRKLFLSVSFYKAAATSLGASGSLPDGG